VIGPASMDVLDSLLRGPLTCRALADDTGRSYPATNQALQALRRRGCVLHAGAEWHVTEAGRAEFAKRVGAGVVPGVASAPRRYA
jgi:predicted transcriptional regulator